jgi:hypothetical protein
MFVMYEIMHHQQSEEIDKAGTLQAKNCPLILAVCWQAPLLKFPGQRGFHFYC